MSLYLIIEIIAIIVPLIFSFDKNLQFHKNWKSVIASFSIVGLIYIVGDIYFAKHGIWGFNAAYHSNIVFWGLPIEEWLFFIAIPYASIFSHYALVFVLPKMMLSNKITNIISIILIAILSIVVVYNFDKIYTTFNYIILIIAIILAFFDKTQILNRFYITFLFILVPFLITDSIITGSFTSEPIVWYNDAANLGIRIFTIPIEDMGYAFSLLFLNLLLMSKFQVIFKSKSN